MHSTDLHQRVREMLDAAGVSDRTDPGPPETIALTSLLLSGVRSAAVRRQIANARSVDDCLTWLAVDRVALLLPPERQARLRIATRQPAEEALAQMVRAVAHAEHGLRSVDEAAERRRAQPGMKIGVQKETTSASYAPRGDR